MTNPFSNIIKKIKPKDKEFEDLYVVLDYKDSIISVAKSLENAENDFHRFNIYKNLFDVRVYKLFDLEVIEEIKRYLNELSF